MGSKVPQPSPNVGPSNSSDPQSSVTSVNQVLGGRTGPSPGETAEQPAPVSPPPPPKKD